MFSLSYTSAYDPYHTVFRYLALLISAEDFTLTMRTTRVADFFLCFPWTLKDLRAPQDIPVSLGIETPLSRSTPKQTTIASLVLGLFLSEWRLYRRQQLVRWLAPTCSFRQSYLQVDCG